MSRIRCPRKTCRELIDPTVDGLGRVSYECPVCAIVKQGLCRHCRKPIGYKNRGSATRCPTCSYLHRRSTERKRDRERYAQRKETVLAGLKRRREQPAYRAYRSQYMKAYRAAHPRDGFDRAYNRAYMAACRANPDYNSKENRRKRERRAQQRAA